MQGTSTSDSYVHFRSWKSHHPTWVHVYAHESDLEHRLRAHRVRTPIMHPSTPLADAEYHPRELTPSTHPDQLVQAKNHRKIIGKSQKTYYGIVWPFYGESVSK